MGNLWLNLRLFYWHLQIGPDPLTRVGISVTFLRNPWWVGRLGWNPLRWFDLCEPRLFGR